MYVSDIRHPTPSLAGKLEHLYRLNRHRKIDPGFRPPYLSLLEKLGHPHKNLPPVIHVAGTNGKGSVIAFLQSMLSEQGYNVHTYTSPHLIRFNERIGLSGRPIADTDLETLLDEVIALNDNAPVTFFEITTALAFRAFADTPADIVLLEVGMGGRLDCTNVIEKPAVSILTPIGRDHCEYLGDTLDKIAGEKAGIIKPFCPVVVGKQSKDAVSAGVLNVFKTKADEVKAPITFVETIEPLPGDAAMTAPHQSENAATALKALEVVKERFPVSREARQQGLRKAQWPGRLQRLDSLGSGHEIWLDGGHNESAGHALARQIGLWRRQDKEPRPLHLICGFMAGKDVTGFLGPLKPYLDELHLCGLPREPLMQDPLKIAEELKEFNIPVSRHATWEEALLRASNTCKTSGRILITGSLYLAGAVLGSIISRDDKKNCSGR